jgi:hypothetical protein
MQNAIEIVTAALDREPTRVRALDLRRQLAGHQTPRAGLAPWAPHHRLTDRTADVVGADPLEMKR